MKPYSDMTVRELICLFQELGHPIISPELFLLEGCLGSVHSK